MVTVRCLTDFALSCYRRTSDHPSKSCLLQAVIRLPWPLKVSSAPTWPPTVRPPCPQSCCEGITLIPPFTRGATMWLMPP